MKLSEYKTEVLRTFAYRKECLDPKITDLLHCAIGFATEVSELLEATNKNDIVNVGEEIADGMWYIVNLANFTKYPTDDYVFQQPMSYFSAREYLHNHIILSGRLLDVFKKSIYYGKELNIGQIHELIYGIIHNANCLCKASGLQMSVILKRNIDKLRIRFPEKFTEQLAENRDLNSERQALEGFQNVLFGILSVGELFYYKNYPYKKYNLNSATMVVGLNESESTINFKVDEIVQTKK